MIYCILGMIMLFGNSEANITTTTTKKHIPNRIIVCDLLTDTHVSCVTKSTEKTLTQNYTPIEKIPRGVKIIEAIMIYPEPFLKNSHTIFHDFRNLTDIRLIGILDFFLTASVDKGTPERTELINRLFDLPNLKQLSLEYWRMDDSELKLPHKLETISLKKCNISKLDLTLNQNLVDLKLVANDLKNMPELSDPPPPLRRLILSGNSDLAFSVLDIVHLCHLKYLGVSKFNANSDDLTKKYCECVRLKEYMREFNIIEHEFIHCDDSNSAINCSSYPVEDVKKIHKMKCETVETKKELSAEIATEKKSWLSENSVSFGLGFGLLCSALVNVLLVAAVYSRARNTTVEESTPSIFEEETEV